MNDLYEVKDGKVLPIKADEMEWLLRYGDEREILKYRLYIAHIVNLYRTEVEGAAKDV